MTTMITPVVYTASVTSPRSRLNREVIIERALDLARTDGKPGEAPTGKSLGTALAVDRSAIWRHFADKDDLLLSIADAIFGELVVELTVPAEPIECLRSVWNGAITAFLRYPSVGAQLGSRWIAGPHALRVSEIILGALSEVGVPKESAGLEYRAFIDLTLSYASMLAQHALLRPSERRQDEVAMEVAIRGLDSEVFPSLVAAVDHLFVASEPRIPETIFALYGAGLMARYREP